MNSKKKYISEATSDSSVTKGGYVPPLQPGLRPFNKQSLAPFTDEVSHYGSPLLQYDSYDGKMDLKKKQIKKIENQARKITNYIKKHPNSTFSDDDGNNINQYPNGKNKKSIVPIKESYNKKTIRLTENQLLNVIRQIIKEIKNPI